MTDIINIGNQIILILVTIIISMTGFWMMIGRNFPTRSEVAEIMENRVHVIEAQMRAQGLSDAKVRTVIEQNTEAIHGLRTQMAVLNKTLELMNKND